MKTVLITGANKSIGFETAKQLTTQGHKVYVGSRDLQKGEAAVAQLKEQGAQNVEAIQIDITDRPSIQAASERVGRQEGQLDILINNAGISGDQQQAPSSVPTDEIEALKGSYHTQVHELEIPGLDAERSLIELRPKI